MVKIAEIVRPVETISEEAPKKRFSFDVENFCARAAALNIEMTPEIQAAMEASEKNLKEILARHPGLLD